MCVQKYPLSVAIQKGENRILVVPMINHIGNYSVCSEQYFHIEDTENAEAIGSAVLKAVEVIKNSPISTSTPKEQEENAAWKKDTRYKSWISFWKNNYHASFRVYDNGTYSLNSSKRMEKHRGFYSGSIKKMIWNRELRRKK